MFTVPRRPDPVVPRSSLSPTARIVWSLGMAIHQGDLGADVELVAQCAGRPDPSRCASAARTAAEDPAAVDVQMMARTPRLASSGRRYARIPADRLDAEAVAMLLDEGAHF